MILEMVLKVWKIFIKKWKIFWKKLKNILKNFENFNFLWGGGYQGSSLAISCPLRSSSRKHPKYAFKITKNAQKGPKIWNHPIKSHQNIISTLVEHF